MSAIIENYLRVEERVREAALKSGRSPDRTRIVAVSKTHPVEFMRELAEELKKRNKQPIFGENYVQEFKQKQEELGSSVECHLIGPLQRNKAKDAVRLFSMIESVHSLHLAEVLDKEARKINKFQEILLQVNVSADQQKSGFQPEQALQFLSEALPRYGNLLFRGLMTITKLYQQPELARPDFSALRELGDRAGALLGSAAPSPFELSMGMSADFPIAVEEGATLVRVGSAIFGERKLA